MITYKTGNILDADADVLVNTVNIVGVMGKGIALQFKKHYPENYNAYKKAATLKQLEPGKVYLVPVNTTCNVKYIANFATKDHWRHPSQLKWIRSGLYDLKEQLQNLPIDSVAIPPLGCGHGGLNWEEVKQLIEMILHDAPFKVIAYTPSEEIAAALKKENRPAAANLTPARAMLLYMFYKYRAMGEEVSEFAAEKLSYFLQRLGEKQLKLNFQSGYYGPYSGKVRHVLYAMNGYYLRGFEQKDTKPFEPLELVVDKKPEVERYIDQHLSADQKNRLKKLSDLIKGFETPYGLELLASVDFIVSKGVPATPKTVAEALDNWSERKKGLFCQDHITLAIDVLNGKS